MRPFSRNYCPKGHPFQFSLVDLVKLRRGGFNGAENGCHAANVLRAGRYPFSLTLLSRPFYAVPKKQPPGRTPPANSHFGFNWSRAIIDMQIPSPAGFFCHHTKGIFGHQAIRGNCSRWIIMGGRTPHSDVQYIGRAQKSLAFCVVSFRQK